MKLRRRQKKCESQSEASRDSESKEKSEKPPKSKTGFTEDEIASTGESVFFPKSRRRARIAANASSSKNGEVNSHGSNLQSGISSEGIVNSTKARRKPLKTKNVDNAEKSSAEIRVPPLLAENVKSDTPRDISELAANSPDKNANKQDPTKTVPKTRKRSMERLSEDVKSSSDDCSNISSSPEKQLRRDLDISSCSVKLSKIQGFPLGSNQIKFHASNEERHQESPPPLTILDENIIPKPNSSSEKQHRQDLDISPCSVKLSKIDFSPVGLSRIRSHSTNEQEQEQEPSLSSNPGEEIPDGKKLSTHRRSYIDREELLSLLEEELGPSQPEDSGNDNEPILDASASPRFESPVKEIRKKADQTTTSQSFYGNIAKDNKATSTPQPGSALQAWLMTARKMSESDQDSAEDMPQIPSTSQTKKQSPELTAKTQMKRTYMHTPLEVRKITRLESTPQVLSQSKPYHPQEDLFGFEKLLLPEPSFFDLVSPVPRPKLAKKLKSKKKYPNSTPKDDGPKPWDGLLDITNSHSSPKRKSNHDVSLSTKLRHEEKKQESSGIHLFEITPVECEKKELLDEYFSDDEPEFVAKSKRIKPKPGQKKKALVNFHMEEALPWQEIDEHELVIETV